MCVSGMGGVMSEPQYQHDTSRELAHALKLVTEALAALDKVGAPADIGARLDQVITRLSQVISDLSQG